MTHHRSRPLNPSVHSSNYTDTAKLPLVLSGHLFSSIIVLGLSLL